jgi:hypothetical protein
MMAKFWKVANGSMIGAPPEIIGNHRNQNLLNDLEVQVAGPDGF